MENCRLKSYACAAAAVVRTLTSSALMTVGEIVKIKTFFEFRSNDINFICSVRCAPFKPEETYKLFGKFITFYSPTIWRRKKIKSISRVQRVRVRTPMPYISFLVRFLQLMFVFHKISTRQWIWALFLWLTELVNITWRNALPIYFKNLVKFFFSFLKMFLALVPIFNSFFLSLSLSLDKIQK